MVLQWVLHVCQLWLTSIWNILKRELYAQSYPCHSQSTPGLGMWMMTIVKKETCDSLLNHLNLIDPNIKFTIEPPNEQGAIPFSDTFPRPSGNNKIITSVYRKPTHMDRYLDFNLNHPKSAKRAVVRALSLSTWQKLFRRKTHWSRDR